jgi:hypothetical protein
MNIQFPEVGVCGLSCRLCPMYQSQTESKCGGCKSLARMAVGCPFITCAVKKREVEFCWKCSENTACDKWKKHRKAGNQRDSFKCYQKLEDDIAFIQKNGVLAFDEQQKIRENILKEMLNEFNDGRSKSYYCIATTLMTIDELKDILIKARQQSNGMRPKDKAKIMHAMINQNSNEKGYLLKLRKQRNGD